MKSKLNSFGGRKCRSLSGADSLGGRIGLRIGCIGGRLWGIFGRCLLPVIGNILLGMSNILDFGCCTWVVDRQWEQHRKHSTFHKTGTPRYLAHTRAYIPNSHHSLILGMWDIDSNMADRYRLSCYSIDLHVCMLSRAVWLLLSILVGFDGRLLWFSYLSFNNNLHTYIAYSQYHIFVFVKKIILYDILNISSYSLPNSIASVYFYWLFSILTTNECMKNNVKVKLYFNHIQVGLRR